MPQPADNLPKPRQPDQADDPVQSPIDTPDDKKRALPDVAEDVDREQIKQFVTQIKSAEQQVGEHIIAALQEPANVAVLTTVVNAGGGQHIVSAGIDRERMRQIQQLLMEAESEREEEIPCIGFHCYVKRKANGEKAIESGNEASSQQPADDGASA